VVEGLELPRREREELLPGEREGDMLDAARGPAGVSAGTVKTLSIRELGKIEA
jgi:hypothetical protein